MISTIAPNYTRAVLSADAVITTASVVVLGWSITSSSSTQRIVTFEDKDGNVYQDVVIGPGNAGVSAFYKSNIPFLAANGLTIDIDTADALVKVTVFHTNTAGAS
jgi:hypothetical protein